MGKNVGTVLSVNPIGVKRWVRLARASLQDPVDQPVTAGSVDAGEAHYGTRIRPAAQGVLGLEHGSAGEANRFGHGTLIDPTAVLLAIYPGT